MGIREATALLFLTFGAACGSAPAGGARAGAASADAEAAGIEDGAPTGPLDAAAGGPRDAWAPPSDAAAVVVPADAAVLGEGGAARTFTVENRCAQTVWAAALPASTFPGGPVEMAPGDAFQVGVDDGWSGRVWGKTGCTTGGAKLSCASDPFPSSLAELTLTKSATGLDFYDVSLVDGFNLPIELAAVGHTPDPTHPYDCGDPTCAMDLNTTCPTALQDAVNGQVIACANDECKVLGGNDASSPDCTYPNSYTEFFKTACPTAYSYPYDDPTSTFTCKGRNDYAVIFCP
jgi:hypothetical protein